MTARTSGSVEVFDGSLDLMPRLLQATASYRPSLESPTSVKTPARWACLASLLDFDQRFTVGGNRYRLATATYRER
ncbi:MAG: hypothetical protein WCB86_09385 [Candidatus Dormiibacterota bacterium]